MTPINPQPSFNITLSDNRVYFCCVTNAQSCKRSMIVIYLQLSSCNDLKIVVRTTTLES